MARRSIKIEFLNVPDFFVKEETKRIWTEFLLVIDASIKIDFCLFLKLDRKKKLVKMKCTFSSNFSFQKNAKKSHLRRFVSLKMSKFGFARPQLAKVWSSKFDHEFLADFSNAKISRLLTYSDVRKSKIMSKNFEFEFWAKN